MRITGTGITQFDIKVKPEYRPLTRLALNWNQLSSGNFVATDRGATADTYDAEVRFYGKENVIDEFIEEINDNRVADSNEITLSQFNATEHIFGANVDHSGTISATVLEMGKKTQNTWKGYSLTARLRALSPAFTGSSSLPGLTNLEVGYEGDSDITVKKIDSYSNAFTYLDRESDAGLFEGTFIFSDANMILLRNYIKTQRSGNFTISAISGVDEPFGIRRFGTGYPYTTKLIDWEDLGMRDVQTWRMRLTFAEQI